MAIMAEDCEYRELWEYWGIEYSFIHSLDKGKTTLHHRIALGFLQAAGEPTTQATRTIGPGILTMWTRLYVSFLCVAVSMCTCLLSCVPGNPHYVDSSLCVLVSLCLSLCLSASAEEPNSIIIVHVRNLTVNAFVIFCYSKNLYVSTECAFDLRWFNRILVEVILHSVWYVCVIVIKIYFPVLSIQYDNNSVN
jgi:hypothetical protein